MSIIENFMEQALQLAECGRCTVSPNPMVGCIIVNNNDIVGRGFHQRAGEPHAEVFALAEAGEKARGAEAYVTLEPCCHYGRTPPCTDALIQAGIKKVYIACQDPNPLVAGKGIQALNDAGIETVIGIKEKEALTLNKAFFHFITHKRPFVIAKWAMSLDGKTVVHPQDNRIISDDACHHHAHEIRQTVDAILIGSQTALLDNPQLTARRDGKLMEKQPWRIILASRGNLPLDHKIFSAKLPGKTIVAVTSAATDEWIKAIEQKNIIVWVLPANSDQHVDIHALLKKLHEHSILSLLVEGGEKVRNHFFSEHLIDEIQVYLSPVFIGDLPQKETLSTLQYQRVGDSLFVQTSREKNHV